MTGRSVSAPTNKTCRWSRCKAARQARKDASVRGVGSFVPPAKVWSCLLQPSSGLLTQTHLQALLPRSMVVSVGNPTRRRHESGVPGGEARRKKRTGKACRARRRRRRLIGRVLATRAAKASRKEQALYRGRLEGPWPFDSGQVIMGPSVTSVPGGHEDSLVVHDLDPPGWGGQKELRRVFHAPLLLSRRSWLDCVGYLTRKQQQEVNGRVSPYCVGRPFYQRGGPAMLAVNFELFPPPSLSTRLKANRRDPPATEARTRVSNARANKSVALRCMHGKVGNCFACHLIADARGVSIPDGGFQKASSSRSSRAKPAAVTGQGGGSLEAYVRTQEVVGNVGERRFTHDPGWHPGV